MAASEALNSPPGLRADLDARFRRPLMRFFLRRVKTKAEAEDLTQEVFARLMGSKNLEHLDHAESFVFTIALNLLRDAGRKAEIRRHATPFAFSADRIDEFTHELVEDRTPERVLSGCESLEDVFLALDELGERTRDIFILFRLENMKQYEIAALYGLGVSTVEKHVMKATLHLTARFGSK